MKLYHIPLIALITPLSVEGTNNLPSNEELSYTTVWKTIGPSADETTQHIQDEIKQARAELHELEVQELGANIKKIDSFIESHILPLSYENLLHNKVLDIAKENYHNDLINLQRLYGKKIKSKLLLDLAFSVLCIDAFSESLKDGKATEEIFKQGVKKTLIPFIKIYQLLFPHHDTKDIALKILLPKLSPHLTFKRWCGLSTEKNDGFHNFQQFQTWAIQSLREQDLHLFNDYILTPMEKSLSRYQSWNEYYRET